MIVAPDAQLTLIENAGSDALAHPSVTEITIPLYVPFAAVPLRRPLVVPNVAHDGWPTMENVRVPVFPAKSAALG